MKHPEAIPPMFLNFADDLDPRNYPFPSVVRVYKWLIIRFTGHVNGKGHRAMAE